jgi:molybdopterin/thiamine biosynthesis adenylyltransferase
MEKRYRRHVDLLTEEQWEHLVSMRILVAGCGGLGSHVLELLARLAPFRLELWDPGILDEPDLNRQCLYIPADLGRQKTDAAKNRLLAINDQLDIAVHSNLITAQSLAGDDFNGVDVCFDCLDSFSARASLEKALLGNMARHGTVGIPVFHGGVSGFYGQVATFFPPDLGYEELLGPGYELAQADPKPVFPPAVAIVASLQVSGFIAWLRAGATTGQLELVTVDCEKNAFERIRVT